MPVDPDATLKVPVPGLGPVGWESESKSSGGGLGLGRAWGAVEDFSEWVVRGTQNTFSTVGVSLVSGVGLALKGLVVLAVAALFVYAGTWFGKVYGPRLRGLPAETPVVPPSRTLTSSPAQAAQACKQLMTGFYGAINSKDYKSAYAALSPGWQKALSYKDFAAGYGNTQSAVCQVKKVTSLAGGRYELAIRLDVVENGRGRQYSGVYVAIPTASGWKLDEGTIR